MKKRNRLLIISILSVAISFGHVNVMGKTDNHNELYLTKIIQTYDNTERRKPQKLIPCTKTDKGKEIAHQYKQTNDLLLGSGYINLSKKTTKKTKSDSEQKPRSILRRVASVALPALTVVGLCALLWWNKDAFLNKIKEMDRWVFEDIKWIQDSLNRKLPDAMKEFKDQEGESVYTKLIMRLRLADILKWKCNADSLARTLENNIFSRLWANVYLYFSGKINLPHYSHCNNAFNDYLASLKN